MPFYHYRAVDADANPVVGTMLEESADRVVAMLAEKGYQVNSVAEVTPQAPVKARRVRLSWEDLEFFNAQVLALTRSGLPLAPGIAALAQEVRRPGLRTVLNDVQRSLEQGLTLHEALERHAGAFPQVYVAAVRAGEATGNLSAVLEQCAEYAANMATVRSRMWQSLVYPTMVSLVSVVVLGVMLCYVVPSFEQLLKDFGARLPAPTIFWIDISRIVRAHYGVLIAVACLLLIAAVSLRRLRAARYALDWLKLRLWGVGRVFNTVSMARFCRSLGVLLTGKAPVDASIELAAATCGNVVLENAARNAAQSVRGGTRLALAFEMTGYFNGLFCWLVEVAETRGDVHTVLLELAKNYEETFARSSRTAVSLLTPVVLLFLGGLVLWIVAALYLPIFTLSDAISGS